MARLELETNSLESIEAYEYPFMTNGLGPARNFR
jgi:hypothetical protein